MEGIWITAKAATSTQYFARGPDLWWAPLIPRHQGILALMTDAGQSLLDPYILKRGGLPSFPVYLSSQGGAEVTQIQGTPLEGSACGHLEYPKFRGSLAASLIE